MNKTTRYYSKPGTESTFKCNGCGKRFLVGYINYAIPKHKGHQRLCTVCYAKHRKEEEQYHSQGSMRLSELRIQRRYQIKKGLMKDNGRNL